MEQANPRHKSVKVIDHKPHTKRKNELYNFLGQSGIFPRKMHVGQGVFYPIVNEEDLENLLKQETVNKAKEKGFEILTPIEYGAMHTVVIKEIDSMVDDYSAEDIKNNVEELNIWAKVSEIVKMPTTSKMLKIKFESTHMAQRALEEGVVILYQRIPPRRIEREIFVRLQPCNNCFGYSHETKNCSKGKMTLCAFCGEEGHRQQQCTSTAPKCINCGEAHKTLAARCQIRKDLIKEKRKAIRERSKSRSRSQTRTGGMTQQGITFADIAGTDTRGATSSTEEIKQLTTIILSAVIYSQYMETIIPGSFQNNMNIIYKKNGLNPVKFPEQVPVAGMSGVYKDILKGQLSREAEGLVTEEDMDENQEAELTTEMDIEGTAKRMREASTSPQEATDIKKKKETVLTEDKQSRLRLAPQEKPPIPPPPKPQRMPTAKAKPKTGNQEKVTEKEIEQQIQKERQAASARSRTASQSSVASDTSVGSRLSSKIKDMEIIIYVPDTEGYRKLFSGKLKPEDKERIINKLKEGSAKVTWDHPSVKREELVQAISQGFIAPEQLRFRMVKREEYFWIKEIPKTNRT